MTKIKIQIKNRWTDSILFEYEKEENTIKDTLIEAIKNGTNLNKANLCGADLRGINLCCIDLSDADLHGTDLHYADLSYACLIGVDLSYANLRATNLSGVDFSYANFSGADLHYANLYGANFHHAKDLPYIPIACPSNGAFIGWKKVKNHLVKLEIPEDAKRCSATTRKCRCEFAKVLAITDLYEKNPISKILNNLQQSKLLYKVGEMVYPDSFDDDRWNECSHGIHFFINKQDAIDY